MFRVLGILVFSFIISSSVFAVSGFETCDGFDGFRGVRIDNSWNTSKISCDDLIPLLETYKNFSLISPVPLLAPFLSVVNQPLAIGEAYVSLSIRVEVGADPLDRTAVDALSQHFSHEMGHHLFYSYVFAERAEYKTISDVVVPLLSASMDEDSTQAMIDVLSQNLPNDMVYFDVFSENYQELFGDVVAAVMSEDPEVMVKAMNNFKAVKANYRSFLTDIPMDPETATTPHYYFSPIRTQLWKWITPRLSNKKKLLSDLLDIFISETERLSKDADRKRSLPAVVAARSAKVKTVEEAKDLLRMNQEDIDSLLKKLNP